MGISTVAIPKERLCVAILAGGISNEREISLMSAEQIKVNLPEEKFEMKVIELTKENILDGSIFNGATFASIDCAFIALHGKFGEDGRIQSVLDMLGVRYTGSGVLASSLAFDKVRCQEYVSKHTVLIPRTITLYDKRKRIEDVDMNIRTHFGYPCVVKPNASGSSVGVSIVASFEGLQMALQKAFAEDVVVLVQQYIKGRELACGVLGNTQQTELIMMPVIEVVPHDSDFFDYQTKYFSKTTEEICPARIPEAVALAIQEQSRKIHELLGCKGLTRSDFMIADDGQVYFLEINTIPGQTEASLVPKEAAAMGMSFPELLEKQIELALM